MISVPCFNYSIYFCNIYFDTSVIEVLILVLKFYSPMEVYKYIGGFFIYWYDELKHKNKILLMHVHLIS